MTYKDTEVQAAVSVSRHGEQLLGFDTSTALGLVKITYNLNQEITSDTL
jgi:hypothetical protein